MKIKKNWQEILLILVLLIVSAYFRFKDLGYSEYIPDEVAVLMPLREDGSFSINFLLEQRKGPVQYLVATIPYLITHDVFNEFAIRIPFALASILAVFFLYNLTKEVTNDKWTAFFSALLFTVNGFVVAFGRIVQYQSLNMLFSFIGIYLFAKHRPIWGTIFLGLSLLSHWDVIYVFPIILVLFIQHLQTLSTRRETTIVIGKCLGIGMLVILPFMIPYSVRYIKDASNQDYFSSRAGIDDITNINYTDKISDYIFRSELYNPFLLLSFILVFATVALLSPKKSWVFYLWLMYSLLLFLLFIRKPGTHVYNMFIPLSILAGIGVHNLFEVVSRISKLAGKFSYSLKIFLSLVILIPLLCVYYFLCYQTYLIFIDHSVEYPWQQEHLSFGKSEHLENFPWLSQVYPNYGVVMETKSYDHTNLTNNIIGFPLYRNWEEANKFLVARNAESGQNLGYITNETRSIAAFYMDLPYEYNLESSYYAIGVKRPLSFVKDYKFSQIKGKNTIYKVSGEFDDTLTRIYLVE